MTPLRHINFLHLKLLDSIQVLPSFPENDHDVQNFSSSDSLPFAMLVDQPNDQRCGSAQYSGCDFG